MQGMRSMAKVATECGVAFLEIRLFLENHSLEFHEIWRENTFLKKKNKQTRNWDKKKLKFDRDNSRYSS